MIMAEQITRKDFLKKLGLAAISLGLLSRGNLTSVSASVDDNLNSGGGLQIDTRPPANIKKGWICTDPNYGKGVLYYWDKTVSKWVPTKSTWTE